jgi:hypothetical protein
MINIDGVRVNTYGETELENDSFIKGKNKVRAIAGGYRTQGRAKCLDYMLH